MKFIYDSAVIDFTTSPTISVGYVAHLQRWVWRVRVEGVESLRGTSGTEAEAWSEARKAQRSHLAGPKAQGEMAYGD